MRELIKIENAEIRFHENWPDIDVNLVMLVLDLGRTSTKFNNQVELVCKTCDISVFELEVLVLLRSFPYPHRLTPSWLSKSLMVSSGGLTKVLIKLENKGYITRDQNPTDKRSRIVRLTDEGISFIEKNYPYVENIAKHFFQSKLNKKELLQLNSLLIKLLKN